MTNAIGTIYILQVVTRLFVGEVVHVAQAVVEATVIMCSLKGSVNKRGDYVPTVLSNYSLESI